MSGFGAFLYIISWMYSFMYIVVAAVDIIFLRHSPLQDESISITLFTFAMMYIFAYTHISYT